MSPNSDSYGSRALQCLAVTSALIASCLDSPLDLLNLSRTCKTMRGCFRQSSTVWNQALENYGNIIAPRPDARRAYTWIILNFTRECMTCGIETQNPLRGFPASRLCHACMGTQLIAARPEYMINTFWDASGRAFQRRPFVFRYDAPGIRHPSHAYHEETEQVQQHWPALHQQPLPASSIGLGASTNSNQPPAILTGPSIGHSNCENNSRPRRTSNKRKPTADGNRSNKRHRASEALHDGKFLDAASSRKSRRQPAAPASPAVSSHARTLSASSNYSSDTFCPVSTNQVVKMSPESYPAFSTWPILIQTSAIPLNLC
ncbi:hypothetical protein RhiJN_24235 [Ceratobasidium sp. AG-Ba]|nr:hypothetical protein RhiJN_24235 [Ceratobasidium sp. AG-Ba]